MALFTIGARYNGVGTTHSDRMTRMKILKPPRQMKVLRDDHLRNSFSFKVRRRRLAPHEATTKHKYGRYDGG